MDEVSSGGYHLKWFLFSFRFLCRLVWYPWCQCAPQIFFTTSTVLRYNFVKWWDCFLSCWVICFASPICSLHNMHICWYDSRTSAIIIDAEKVAASSLASGLGSTTNIFHGQHGQHGQLVKYDKEDKVLPLLSTVVNLLRVSGGK